MAECPECKREIKPGATFCGYCGTRIYNAPNVVIDGKKNKVINRYVSKFIYERKFNLIAVITFSFIFVFSILGFLYALNKSISDFSFLKDAIYQISCKYKYLQEGVSYTYISKDINNIFNCFITLLYTLGSGLLSLFSLFYIVFHSYMLFIIKKNSMFSYDKRPVSIVRIFSTVVRIFLIILLVFSVLLLLCYGIRIFL